MSSKSNTFCILPWMHVATNSSGNYRVCCNSTPGENFITVITSVVIIASGIKVSEK